MKRRVLLVEDDPQHRQVVALILAREGYEVIEAETVRQAIGALDEAPPPAAIVLDLLLPGTTGWEFLDWLNKRGTLSRIPVVVVTGSDHGDHARALHPRVVACLTKPIHMDDLLSALAVDRR